MERPRFWRRPAFHAAAREFSERARNEPPPANDEEPPPPANGNTATDALIARIDALPLDDERAIATALGEDFAGREVALVTMALSPLAMRQATLILILPLMPGEISLTHKKIITSTHSWHITLYSNHSA